MAGGDKNVIFFVGLSDHFARGTLPETYLKDVVFEINGSRKKKELAKSKDVTKSQQHTYNI